MNPILLKPKSDMKSQVMLLGEPYKDLQAREFYQEFAMKEGLRAVRESLEKLFSEFEVVVIEGAGSPAELNLYDSEIANMRVAEVSNSPVLLVGDIDRGGVFASLVGTLSLLKPEHREMVKGFVINKFRGDVSILEPGLRQLETITARPVLGVVPYLESLDLPWEDSISLETLTKGSRRSIDLAVIRLPLISNSTDFDSLRAAGASVRLVRSVRELGTPDAVIVPGTKNTVRDLQWLKKEGLDREIVRLRKEGVPIIGICGGYQMLGKNLHDPQGIEGGAPGEYEGLGLLDVSTTFNKYHKTTRRVSAEIIKKAPILHRAAGKRVRGYEIHMGDSMPGKGERVFKIFAEESNSKYHLDGLVSQDGIVFGSYLHGLFDDVWITSALLEYLAERKGAQPPRVRRVEASWRDSLELLARTVRDNVDIPRIFRITGLAMPRSRDP
jgi:adenosylcobyric acid synthase